MPPHLDLGAVANAAAADFGKPLDGVRVLAAEGMQALPYATQLLARLGADVVKVESPRGGESGRASRPGITDPDGRHVGATFLRNNLGKRSVTLDLKHPEGRELFTVLAGRFDVVAENFKPGTMDRLGLGYGDLAGRWPRVVYVSVSGFGNTVFGGDSVSPYRTWPAYAPVVEAMSGIYEYRREGDRPPLVAPMGGVADIGAALFTSVGILAALRHRDRTGHGQYLDVSMFDSIVAITDLVTNFWSLGMRSDDGGPPLIMHSCRASDGWFVLQVGREHQFTALAGTVGRPEWTSDPRFAERTGWVAHFEEVVRPAVEAWAAGLTRAQACALLAGAGIAAGACLTAAEVVADPHVRARNMLVAMPRPDGEPEPVLVPGNPVKLSKVADGPQRRVPWLGEHTEEVLSGELGLTADDLARLREAGAV
ncbi:CaiB/BaiF CoA transferase family protein [Dactylosporangium sucinum]|uniref:CoA transferase n=1 Tax=Dactylosporangium sucinum TaxID=1424081 RepID=A0A917WXD8_9ACTN|nr:CaiB/BaiF CoA-transferase family protein [Dactylosporangium sucinum]GGM38849.1 hypothetical protein GCM10007977_045430 [Dactylosporangium sucinum]